MHRSDCPRLIDLQESSPERIIEVEWGHAPRDTYEVDVGIEAYDRQGLLRDVTELFANARINVLAINTQSNVRSHTATMRVRVEVPDLGSLSRLLERINARRRVFLTSTRVRGDFVLRIAVLSFRTHADTVRAALEDIVAAARECETQD